MPITTSTGTATITDSTVEGTTFLSKITDGISSLFSTGKSPTDDEGKYAAYGLLLGGAAVGSMVGRTRQRRGQAPVAGFLF